jgi:hypothetical protein
MTPDRTRIGALAAAALLAGAAPSLGQSAAPTPFEITDNSFLVEEAFNQEAGIFQNIFTWARDQDGDWFAVFTQEWPAPAMTHQFSYSVPVMDTERRVGVGDILLNYRYQLLEERPGRPAIAPRFSVILPTGSEKNGQGDGVVGIQMNGPVSKQFGDWYLHGNAGWTWLPDVRHVTHVAGSTIWRAAPMFNMMLEGLAIVNESFTISPGVRGGWNFGDTQVVIGGGVPVTRGDGSTTTAVLTYFSIELPFR